jgi:hypothetical protein
LTAVDVFSGPRAVVDMWHPTGAPQGRLALGELAGPGSGEDDGPIELAIIAPSAAEASREWVTQAIAVSASRLGRHGIAWIVVPRRSRVAAERALRRFDLTLLDAVLAIPRWPRSTDLVPLAPAALRYAATRNLGLSSATSEILAGLVSRTMSKRLVRRLAPSCALVAARAPMLPILGWLGDLDGSDVATATVSSGDRRDARVAIVLRFPPQRRAPDLFVKAALDDAGVARLQAERAALRRLAPTAAGAGAAVPIAKPCSRPWLLATEPIAGSSAAALLTRAPRRLPPLARTVSAWLLRWNRATAWRTTAAAELLERRVLGPVSRLLADGTASEPYARALAMLAARQQEHGLLVVASHGDLTMANVLLARSSPVILDWESATADGLPLTDLWYAIADGVARAARVTHASAVQALVTGSAPALPALALMPAHHAAALRLSADETILAFHACWLAHADNELRRGSEHRPFTATVRAIVARQLLWPRET